MEMSEDDAVMAKLSARAREHLVQAQAAWRLLKDAELKDYAEKIMVENGFET